MQQKNRMKGAYHGAEIPFVFQQLQTTHTPQELELATSMTRYWTQFGIQGDSNYQDLPIWPSYRNDNNRMMMLDIKLETSTNYNIQKCNFWSSAVYDNTYNY